MIGYNLKLATRNLASEKVSSIIKITGLALGLVVFMLITLYTDYEKSYDTSIPDAENIWRIGFVNTKETGEQWNGAYVPVPLINEIYDKCPEVSSAVRLYSQGDDVPFYKDEIVFETNNCFFVDSAFFSVFKLPILNGDDQDPLKEPNSIALSQSMATKIFGNEDPIGKQLKYRNSTPVTVSCVFQDMPDNSSIKYDALISMYTPNFVYNNNHNWDLHFVKVFLKVQQGTNAALLANKISLLAEGNKPKFSQTSTWEFYLETLPDIHLRSKVYYGRESTINTGTIRLISFISVFILIIALINHINLSVSQFLNSVKQIGVERVSGQSSVQLVAKKLAENTFVFFIAFIFSVILLLPLISFLNSILNKDISIGNIGFAYISKTIIVLIIGVLTTTFCEVIILLRVNLSDALKGKLKGAYGNTYLKRGLIAFQFLVSLVLLFVTLVFYLQANYMLNKDIGLTTDNVLVVKGNTINSSGGTDYASKISSFRNELKQFSWIKNVTVSNVVPGIGSYTDGVALAADASNRFCNNSIIVTDNEFLKTYNLQLIAGSNFPETSTNRSLAIISKRSAQKLGFTNFEDAIGKTITREYLDKDYEIVGVVDDFTVSNLVNEIYPITMYYSNSKNSFYSISYNSTNTNKVLRQVENAWMEIFDQSSCRSFFINDSYKNVYENEYQQVKLYSTCALMAILIACIGLFGLAYYSILLKTKEIGIRKVNGARIREVIWMIYYEYFILILLAAIPGFMVAFLIATKWLENYYFKINLGVITYLIPIVLMTIVTIITVSYHAIKASVQNPIKALRYE